MLEVTRTKKVLLIGLLFSILSFSHLPVAVFPHIFDKNGAAQFITLTVIAALLGGYIVWRSSQFVTHAYLRAAILFLLITIPMTRYTDRAIRQRTNAQNSEGAI